MKRVMFFAVLLGVTCLLAGGFLFNLKKMTGCLFARQKSSSTHFDADLQKLKDQKNLMPVVIMGSGPAGISAAQYTVRGGFNALVISGPKPGGALTETSYIENWPGENKILGKDLMQKLSTQAQSFGARFMQDSVVEVDFSSWPYTVKTDNGQTIKACALIIATGSTPKMLGIKGEEAYWGKGVTTCAICDAPFHKGHEVVVVGGGDSAAEEALQLASYASKITILVRKESMRASAAMQARLSEHAHISIRYNVEVKEIEGDGHEVTGIQLYNNLTETTETMPIKGVFLAIGHYPNTAIFKDKLAMDQEGYLIMNGRMQSTSVPGVFAAGDVQDFTYRQAAVASGDGVKAALDATQFLREIGFTSQLATQLAPNMFKVNNLKRSRVALGSLKTPQELELASKKSSGPILIDFYADYCSSCMRMLPIVESMAQELSDQVTFYKVDMSESQELAKYCSVQSIPTMLVYDKGQLVGRYNKAMTENQLREFAMRFVEGDVAEQVVA